MSCEIPMQAGSLRQIAWATRIEPIPVDDPGFWQGVVGFCWINEAEAHAANRGKTFVRSPGYGVIELRLGHRLFFRTWFLFVITR